MSSFTQLTQDREARLIELAKQSMQKHGYASQVIKSAEECAEYSQATLKHLRKATTESKVELLKEYADLLITVYQVIAFEVSNADDLMLLQECVDSKLDKLETIINNSTGCMECKPF